MGGGRSRVYDNSTLLYFLSRTKYGIRRVRRQAKKLIGVFLHNSARREREGEGREATIILLYRVKYGVWVDWFGHHVIPESGGEKPRLRQPYTMIYYYLR